MHWTGTQGAHPTAPGALRVVSCDRCGGSAVERCAGTGEVGCAGAAVEGSRWGGWKGRGWVRLTPVELCSWYWQVRLTPLQPSTPRLPTVHTHNNLESSACGVCASSRAARCRRCEATCPDCRPAPMVGSVSYSQPSRQGRSGFAMDASTAMHFYCPEPIEAHGHTRRCVWRGLTLRDHSSPGCT